MMAFAKASLDLWRSLGPSVHGWWYKDNRTFCSMRLRDADASAGKDS